MKAIVGATLLLLLLPNAGVADPIDDLCRFMHAHAEWWALETASAGDNPIRYQELIEKRKAKEAELTSRFKLLFGKREELPVTDLKVEITALLVVPATSADPWQPATPFGLIMHTKPVGCDKLFYITALFGATSRSYPYRSDYEYFKPILRELNSRDTVLLSGVLLPRNREGDSSIKYFFSNISSEGSMSLTIKLTSIKKL